jgi:hypothetical protein
VFVLAELFKFLAPFILFQYHHVIKQTVYQTEAHLLVSLRCKFEIHLFIVKVAVERSLKCEAVLDI